MEFRGVLVVVSHDRYFMDKVVDHLLVFEGEGKLKEIIGNYSIYRHKKNLQEKNANRYDRDRSEDKTPEAPKEKTKLTYAERIEMKKLGKEIERLEIEKERSTEMLMEPRGHEEIQQISDVLTKVVKEIDEKTERWMELAEYAQ